MNHQTEIICALILTLCVKMSLMAYEAVPVASIEALQQTPDVDNGCVVWAEQFDGDWNIYGYDLFNVSVGFFVVDDLAGSNQIAPAIWNDRVVYQDDSYGDWDVYVSDISDANVPVPYLLTLTEQYFLDNQTAVAIHGNTAVWQSYVIVDDGQGDIIEDWGIFAADITDPNTPFVYLVDDYSANQQSPAVYRSRVVYQDDYYGDWDILSADIWLKKSPQYYNVIADETGLNQENPAVWGDTVICQADTGEGDYDIVSVDMSNPEAHEITTVAGGLSSQINPDISGHLVVWQDNRNGNWDIYGYNLITDQEFLITTETASSTSPHPADQTNPAISGQLVVWEDMRDSPDKPMQVYYAWLSGDIIAECSNPLAGDIDGDCRVNLVDMVLVAVNWLGCGLDPASACSL